jgi:pimeloyl-ACP methyl ester carboxylesterase
VYQLLKRRSDVTPNLLSAGGTGSSSACRTNRNVPFLPTPTVGMSERQIGWVMVEDHRAGLGIDRRHDEEDRAAGRRTICPTLCLWSKRDDLELLYGDVLAVWRPWASTVTGFSIDCGHHMAEEASAEVAEALLSFMAT